MKKLAKRLIFRFYHPVHRIYIYMQSDPTTLQISTRLHGWNDVCEPTCTTNYYPDDLTELLLNDDIVSDVNDDLVGYDSSDRLWMLPKQCDTIC